VNGDGTSDGRDDGESWAVASGGAAAAILLGAALVPLRSTLGPTNVALLMTALVVVAAVGGGRIAGVTTGVTAALSFNFFHSKPYLTMRVADTHDVATIGLIVAIGLAVGQLTAVRARRTAEVRDHVGALRGLEAVSAVASAGSDPRDVLAAIRHELIDAVGLVDARFESRLGSDPDTTVRPPLERDGSVHVNRRIYTGRGFALPAEGVRVPVPSGAEPVGQLVLEGAATTTVTVEQRRAIVAMADQLASSIRQHPEVSLLDLEASTLA
jgi:K+-sensing histidine kinase KdpD